MDAPVTTAPVIDPTPPVDASVTTTSPDGPLNDVTATTNTGLSTMRTEVLFDKSTENFEGNIREVSQVW